MKIPALLAAFVLALLVLQLPVLQAQNPDVKLRVTVRFTDGSSEEYKLDWIDENKIVVFERGTLEPREYKRKDVLSLSFNEDFGNQFKAGEEGFVLKNRQVLLGHPTGMDTTTFWIVPKGSQKEERLARDEVLFIQFEKPAAGAVPTKNATGDSASLTLVVANGWEDSGVDVVAGQEIWFTVSDLEMYSCGPEAPRVNADGKDPLIADNRRPLPDVKLCALIARIGKGQPFRVGLNKTPIQATQKGRLYLAVNDHNYGDNVGRLNVYIKTGDLN